MCEVTHNYFVCQNGRKNLKTFGFWIFFNGNIISLQNYLLWDVVTSDFIFTLTADKRVSKHTSSTFQSIYTYLFVYFSAIIYKRLIHVMECVHVSKFVTKIALIELIVVKYGHKVFWSFRPIPVLQAREIIFNPLVQWDGAFLTCFNGSIGCSLIMNWF